MLYSSNFPQGPRGAMCNISKLKCHVFVELCTYMFPDVPNNDQMIVYLR